MSRHMTKEVFEEGTLTPVSEEASAEEPPYFTKEEIDAHARDRDGGADRQAESIRGSNLSRSKALFAAILDVLDNGHGLDESEFRSVGQYIRNRGPDAFTEQQLKVYTDTAASRSKTEKDYAPPDLGAASARLCALIADATEMLPAFQEGNPTCALRQSIVSQLTLLLAKAQDPASLAHATLLAELSSTNPRTCRSAKCGLAALLFTDTVQQKTAHANALRLANEYTNGIANHLSVDALSTALDVPSALINEFFDALRSTGAYARNHTWFIET